MNPAITKTNVTRRPPLATAAERRAIARHQAALAALDAADRTNALIDAIRVEHPAPKTMEQVVNDILMKPVEPAILPSPVVHTIAAHQSLTSRIVAMTLGGLSLFLAGVAMGRML